MSIFEMIMIVCFGIAWPFSIYRSYTSKNNDGKSLLFLFCVLIGYISGVIHKLLYNFDQVIYLYLLNCMMVFVDVILYYRNKKNYKKF